ncbi:MAG: hypothetical protein M1831_003461 [Alyxoria varia]|nr:MAG: hypothetical protein M1831_003461 [Alyxoria varia]
MKHFSEIDSCRLSLGDKVFVYALTCLSLTNTSGKIPFAAISSDDSLTFLELSSFPALDVNGVVKNAHSGVTCMTAASWKWHDGRDTVITGGRDGLARVWDCLSQGLITELRTAHGEGVSTIAFSAARNSLAVGTELEANPPGDVAIYVWELTDTRNPTCTYTYSHTDTITSLLFSHLNPTHLISASTDGLVTLFDTTIHDEDDAVQTVLNNRSAVQHLLNVPSRSNPKSEDVCTISHDEMLAFLSLSEEEPDAADGAGGGWDVREGLKSDYAIKVMANPVGGVEGVVVCVGANKAETSTVPNVEICTVQPAHNPVSAKTQERAAPQTTTIAELEKAHGEEIVRDVWFHEECPYIMTCGEDGCIRVWGETGAAAKDTNTVKADAGPSSPKNSKKSKKHRRKSSDAHRFKPY